MDKSSNKEEHSPQSELIIESALLETLQPSETSKDENSQPMESSAIEKFSSVDKTVENVKPTEEENQQSSSKLQDVNEVVTNSSDISKTNEPSVLNCSSEGKVNDNNFGEDESNIHYEGDVCVYTDPATKYQCTWDAKKEEWCQRVGSGPCSTEDYKFDGKTYAYYDEHTKQEYIWDIQTNSWKLKNEELKSDANKNSESEDEEEETEKVVIRQDMSKGQYGYENDTHTYTDPSDGTVYLWDKEKSAWFPKVDEDFLAQYQMSYGFVDPNAAVQDERDKEEEDKKVKAAEEQKLEGKRKAPQEPTWFDVGEDCTKVYVSNLPLDLTEVEFVDLMQKCGLVMKDLDTGRMKVKLYTEPKSALFKGDALCTYIKKESVNLALDLIDGYTYRDKKIKVERARFTMKGDAYDASLKPKKKKKKDKEKMKKNQEKLFDWRPDKLRHERGKNEKVVILKNLFDSEIFNKEIGLILEYQQDLREECLKCGAVQKVIIYDRHPEGVAQVNFKEAEAADACVQLLNNRWFGKRQITAETWDGKTKYKVVETEEEINKRLEGWTKFLEDKDNKEKQTNIDNDEKTVLKENPEDVKKKEEVESDNETRSSAGSQDLTDEELSDVEDAANKDQ